MTGDKTEQVKEAAGQVKEQAAQVTDQVMEQASRVGDKAKDQATTRADEQKDRAAQGISGFADALNQVGSSMRDQNPAIANFADTAAGKLDDFARNLNNKDVQELIDDVEQMARRQPAVFIGGAFLAGVFAARFLKSSSGMSTGRTGQRAYGDYYGDRYSQRYADYDTRGFSSQYGSQYGRQTTDPRYRSTSGSTYGSTHGSTYGTTSGSQAGNLPGGYRGGMTTGTTGGQDTPGAVRSGTGDVDASGRGIGTTGSTVSGQTRAPYRTDETMNRPSGAANRSATSTTDPAGTTGTVNDRTRGTSRTSSSS